MKLYALTLLLIAFTSNTSFTSAEEEQVKGSFSASVDGREFKPNKDQLFKGTLIHKTGSIDGRTPGFNVISAIFNGPSYDKKDGSSFNESAQFEIGYEDGKTGPPSVFSVGLQFESNDYAMIKEQSKLSITQFTWEEDHKHFRVSADFDAKMRSWGYPADGKKDVSLKGKMTNIRIAAPSWITSKK